MANGQLTAVVRHLRQLIRRQGAGEVADSQLLERFVRQRDEAAFEVLVWRHGPAVLGLARRLLHDAHDAEDVLQATFLTLVRKAGSIGKRASLGSWLYKVAFRIALRARARASRANSCPALVEDLPAAEQPDAAAWRELRPILDEAIQRLPEKYRTPIVLCYLQGKTNREAAEQLGCPIATVCTRLARAREMLRRRLARHGAAASAGSLAVVLSHQAAPAAVSAALVSATVRGATVFSTSQAGGTLLSGKVTALVEGVSKTMWLTNYQIVGIVLVAGLLAAGGGAWLGRDNATRPAEPPPAQGAQPGAKKQSPAAARAPRGEGEADAGQAIAVTGRVVDPDGKPVAGARLYWPHVAREQPLSETDIEFPERGTTDARGGFRFKLPASDVTSIRQRSSVVAAADGYGIGGAKLPEDDKAADLTIRLVKDRPIKGRILNTEGKPLEGVQVIAASVFPRAPEQLDEFLRAWRQEWDLAHPRFMAQALFLPKGRGMLNTTTDKEGRFQVNGVGADRVAVLLVKGPAVTQGLLYVVNRAGFDPTPYNKAAQERDPLEGRIPGNVPLLYGPAFDYVAAATRPIEGTVREAGTGKPVAGVHIFAGSGYNNGVSAVSDAQGRYRITGLPKAKEYSLHTQPDPKDFWLRRSVRVPDTQGSQPLKVDIELVRGVLLTGRVIDRATGRGVPAGIRYVPLPDNKFFGKPGYDSYRFERLMNSTDSDGRFRLPVIPGTGVLLVQAHPKDAQLGGVAINPYRQAEFSAEDRKHVPYTEKGGDRYFTAATNSLEFLDIENACKFFDLAEDARSVSCDLYLERGRTLRVHVQDAEGKPLAGATVAGMTASWPNTFSLSDASCTVYALDPSRPRKLVFLHPGRALAGRLTLRGDENEAPAVRLVPAGSVTGRVLDTDGQPVAGAEVAPSWPEKNAQELYRQLAQKQGSVQTDKEGRFVLKGVIPDLKFGLSIRQGKAFLAGEPRIGLKEVGSGKTLELGDVRTRPVQP